MCICTGAGCRCRNDCFQEGSSIKRCALALLSGRIHVLRKHRRGLRTNFIRVLCRLHTHRASHADLIRVLRRLHMDDIHWCEVMSSEGEVLLEGALEIDEKLLGSLCSLQKDAVLDLLVSESQVRCSLCTSRIGKWSNINRGACAYGSNPGRCGDLGFHVRATHT